MTDQSKLKPWELDWSGTSAQQAEPDTRKPWELDWSKKPADLEPFDPYLTTPETERSRPQPVRGGQVAPEFGLQEIGGYEPEEFAKEPPAPKPDQPRAWVDDAREKVLQARGFARGVDYHTGVNDVLFRAGYGRMETDDERDNWLTMNVGKDGWAKDGKGRRILTRAGRERAGIPGNAPLAIESVDFTRGDIAETVGDIGPVLGAGIAAGVATGGLGTIPAMAISGGASALAHLADEAIEQAQGYNLQSGGEVAQAAIGEGLASGIGEGVTRGAQVVGRFALGPYRHPEGWLNPFSPKGPAVSRIDPERIALMNKSLASGYMPSPAAVQGSKGLLWPRLEAAARFFGASTEEANARAAMAGRSAMLRPYAATTPSAAGEAAEAKVKTLAAGADDAVRNATERVAREVDTAGMDLQSSLGRAVSAEDAGRGVQESIRNARRQFADEAQRAFSEWESANPHPVSTAPLKQMAQSWLDRLPSEVITADDGTTTRRAIGALSPDGVEKIRAVMRLPDEMPVGELQNMRAFLREASYDPDFLPGVPKKITRDLLRATDEAMEGTGLAELNAWYRQGISQFDDARILRITRDAGKAGAIDAEDVASYLFKPNKTALVRKVRGIVGDEQWNALRRAHFDQMIDGAAGADGAVDSARLWAQTNRLSQGGTLDEIYGAGKAREIREYSRALLAADDKFPVDEVRGASSLADALKARVRAIDQQKALLENRFVDRLTSREYEPETLTNLLLSKDRSRLIDQAKAILGEGSDEWKAIQAAAARRLLNNMVTPAHRAKDVLTAEISAPALRKAIDDVGPEAIEKILGPMFRENLEDFTQQLAFSLQVPSLMGGSIMTSAIALRPTKHIGKIGELLSLKFLLTKPWFIKFMTEGYEAKKTRIVASQVARIMIQGATHMRPDVQQGIVDPLTDETVGVPEPE